MVLLAVLVCLRLGLWQWHRTHEATGTIQNLGYTILWPVFGAAFIYMWIRFLQLELLKDAEDDAELTAMAAGLPVVGDEVGDRAAPEESERYGPELRECESEVTGQTDGTATDVPSKGPAAAYGDRDGSRDHRQYAQDEQVAADHGPTTRGPRVTASRGHTVAVSTVGDEEADQDPELAAYNRALAALAEKEHPSAR